MVRKSLNNTNKLKRSKIQQHFKFQFLLVFIFQISNILYEYNIFENTWKETSTSMIQKRMGHSCWKIGNDILVVGGWDGHKYLKS